MLNSFYNGIRWLIPLLLTARLYIPANAHQLHDPFANPTRDCYDTEQIKQWHTVGLIGNSQQGWQGWLANPKGQWLPVKVGQKLFQQWQVQQIDQQGIELMPLPTSECPQEPLYFPLLWHGNSLATSLTPLQKESS